uniref:PX domain-containing protein n=1 Tax=Panagrolaimus sp. JU765 TaxID=591449 RepID=A0AC34PU78_9BILA
MLAEYETDDNDHSDPLTSQLNQNSDKNGTDTNKDVKPQPKTDDLVEQSLDDDPKNLNNENLYRNNRTESVSVDVNLDGFLNVDISDALSERDKVKYTVHTKTNLPAFLKHEMSVVREHEEFIWLHNCLEDNEDYAGFIIPPAPPKPDFDASREKLQKLGEGEATMTKEEFQKMKQELEQEYLATFKKTVAMHEVFLCRLAAHPVFRNDTNFRVFLEYESDLSVRGRNKKETVGSFFKKLTSSADEMLLSGQKDVDEFFEREKNYMVEYHTHIKDAATKAERVCKLRKGISDNYGKVSQNFEKCAQLEGLGGDKEFGRFVMKAADALEKLKKTEARVATDEELKEADTLRYFTRETGAAKSLLYRRMRCLANYEASNKNLERARARNKDIPKAETEQKEACDKFEEITQLSKKELVELKKRRVEAFKKNLNDLVDFEIRHSKAKLSLLQSNFKPSIIPTKLLFIGLCSSVHVCSILTLYILPSRIECCNAIGFDGNPE